MTPFEMGYKARMDGYGRGENPFDPDKAPYSHRQWAKGWRKRLEEVITKT